MARFCNSVKVDVDACKARADEMGMSGVEISRRVGRSDSWFTNLRSSRTSRSAAAAELVQVAAMAEKLRYTNWKFGEAELMGGGKK